MSTPLHPSVEGPAPVVDHGEAGCSHERPCIGLALGSGSARGWAHIGVLQALAAEGIQPDLICGCSVGAFVGAAAAMGELDALAEWVEAMKWQDVASLLDFGLRGGLIKGERLLHLFRRNFADCDFSSLPLPFACVATDLDSGREVWLREGRVAEAVRASIALPGLVAPVRRGKHLLVDGALVNPVPVSLCRALGAEIVIAVDLGSDLVGRASHHAGKEIGQAEENASPWGMQRMFGRLGFSHGREGNLPSMTSVMLSSINIMQARIARSRLAGEPADVLVTPRLAQMGLMDYHRGSEAIVEGVAAVCRMLPAIHHALSLN